MNVEQFGKYLLLEKLATGGMAEIFLAKTSGSRGVEKFVVIKRILPEYSTDPNFIEMFVEEAKLNVNLSHSNIAQIFDFGVHEGQLFIAMEHVSGKNLRQIIRSTEEPTMKIAKAVYIIKEAAKGLAYAHRAVDKATSSPLNIVHRDISPQNIMISYEGEVKVIDFGIAKTTTDEEIPEVTRLQNTADEQTLSTFHELEPTKTGELKGKFTYMAPEQAIGGKVDARTDVFCLGIVLWELLSGKRLYKCASEIQTLAKAQNAVIPELQADIPEKLREITTKSLTKDIDQRYQSMNEFLTDLNLFFNQTYPNFLAHEFAEDIKDSFKEELTHTKEKIVHYSKIKSIKKPKADEDEDSTVVSSVNNPVSSPSRDSNQRVTNLESRRRITSSRRVIRRKRKRVK